MQKKGFTLVELLAVIVILAIIALITIPIVLKTINNSQEEAEKQSIVGYARVVEDDIANYLLDPTHKYENYKIPDNLDYKGNKVTCGDLDLSTRKLKLKCCKVEGSKTGYDYDNGKVEKSTDNKCNAESGEDTPAVKTAVQELLSKTNDISVTTYEQGSEASHQMYPFEHPQTEQTEALTDYRYIGSDPYNYVDFNCDDNSSNCETWRIVGVFTVKNGSKEEQRIKLIREESIGNMQWDSHYVNEWPSVTLNTYLNGEYYQSMSNLTKSMIEPAETYLGGSTYPYGEAPDMYAWERGTHVYNGHSLKDIKNITLLYPSDYTYTYANGVDNVCYSDGHICNNNGEEQPAVGWLYKSSYNWWLVSPYADYSFVAFYVDSYGRVGTISVNISYGVRPVVYLKSSVQIASGTGTSSDPYKLKI